MESLLEQFVEEPPPPPPAGEPTTVKKKSLENSETDMEIEEKREQLSILSVLGTVKNYSGREMSLGDVKKLSVEDVEKYHHRYQVAMGNQVTGGLVQTALDSMIRLISYLVSIDNEGELLKDIKNNELVIQELTNIAGYVVLKGGRLIALLSGILQVVKHVNFKGKEEPKENTAHPI